MGIFIITENKTQYYRYIYDQKRKDYYKEKFLRVVHIANV